MIHPLHAQPTSWGPLTIHSRSQYYYNNMYIPVYIVILFAPTTHSLLLPGALTMHS